MEMTNTTIELKEDYFKNVITETMVVKLFEAIGYKLHKIDSSSKKEGVFRYLVDGFIFPNKEEISEGSHEHKMMKRFIIDIYYTDDCCFDFDRIKHSDNQETSYILVADGFNIKCLTYKELLDGHTMYYHSDNYLSKRKDIYIDETRVKAFEEHFTTIFNPIESPKLPW